MMFLKTSQNLQEAPVPKFMLTLLKIDSTTLMFSCEYAKFLRTTFTKATFEQLFLLNLNLSTQSL